MLRYGRNEEMTFCVFIGHERQKLFWGIFSLIRRVPVSNFANVHSLRRRLKRYRSLMAEIAVLMFFLYSVASF